MNGDLAMVVSSVQSAASERERERERAVCGVDFFLVLINQEKGKLHCHDAMSKVNALVKAARPGCHALAFVSCWSMPVSVQS